jgi:RNA polymerase sigma-70 factor (ECF subfamily)
VYDRWEEVYAGHYRRLVTLIAVVAGSPADAEEAVQEAFVRALGLTGHRPVPDNPEAWLYRVALNIARSRWRRLVTGRRHQVELIEGDHGDATEPSHSDSRLVLLAALKRLPYEQREALAMHYLADLPVEEIAVRVGSPTGTIKARLSRGRDALAKLLADSTVGGKDHA